MFGEGGTRAPPGAAGNGSRVERVWYRQLRRPERDPSAPKQLCSASLLERVLQVADCSLDLAFDLFALARVGQLGIANGFAGHLFYSSGGLLDGAFDTIFIHKALYCLCLCDDCCRALYAAHQVNDEKND